MNWVTFVDNPDNAITLTVETYDNILLYNGKNVK